LNIESPPAHTLTRESISELAGTAIIVVTAHWCSFKNDAIKSLNNIESNIAESIIKLDLDDDLSLCKYLNVKCSPSLLVLNEGKVAAIEVGNNNIDNITKDINSYLKEVIKGSK
jgi:hypothetical protein